MARAVGNGAQKTFYQRVIELIKKIPEGKIATYGQIAAFAGNPRSARQVAYILHAASEKQALPWHRVINSRGTISLRPKHGYELQRLLLIEEGVVFDEDGRIDLDRFLWLPAVRDHR